MTDPFTRETRSKIMASVKGSDTTPEKTVRSWLHGLGFRFRLNVPLLPGKPDIVLPKYGAIILVHGCFWHRHKNCARSTMPASNVDFWVEKFNKTKVRDRRVVRSLRKLGWRVAVVWECQLREPDRVISRLVRFLKSEG